MTTLTGEQLYRLAYKVAFTAGMNQRYHQRLEEQNANLDWWIRLGVGLFAVATLVTAVWSAAAAHASGWKRTADVSAIVLAVIAACFGTFVSISPYYSLQTLHGQLFQRWSDLRLDADPLLLKAESLRSLNAAVPTVLADRVVDLTTRMNHISTAEPRPDREILAECQADEQQARTGARQPATGPQAPRPSAKTTPPTNAPADNHSRIILPSNENGCELVKRITSGREQLH